MRRILLLVLPVLLAAGLAWGSSSAVGAYAHIPFSVSGNVDPGYPGAQPTAGWNFDAAVAGTYANDYGAGTYTMTVNGAPTRVNDGTWPFAGGLVTANEGYSWSFDGAADWLSRADTGAGDPFDPAEDISIQAVVRPDTVAAGEDCIVAKWETTGNQRGWKLCREAANLVFSTSVDGTAITTNTVNNCFAAYRPAFISATYDESTTTSTLYCDNLATATNNAMSASIFDNTAPFEIGASDTGATLWDGLISDLKLYIGGNIIILEAQHDEMFAQWRGVRSTASPNVYVTTASASPPAIPFTYPASGTEPFIIDQPANAAYIGSPAVNSGGLYGASDLTSKWWRGSYETCAVGNHPDGYVTAENRGAGTATALVDCVTTDKAHGGQSVKFTLDNGTMTKYAEISSSHCDTNWIGQDVSLLLYGKTLSGVANCWVRLREANAGCEAAIVYSTLWSGDPGANWVEIGGNLAAAAWNGATAGWQIQIVCWATGAAYEVVFDASMALQAPSTFHTDASCTTDADADAVCTATIPSLTPSPLSANGHMTVEMTARTPWAGTDLGAAAYLFADGTPGAANTYDFHIAVATDEPIFRVTDNASAQRYVSPDVLNWAADTDYALKVRTGGNNDPGLWWNSAWQTTGVGAGTGMRSAAQSTTYIGSSNTTPADVWIKDLKFYRRKLP